MKQKYSYTKIVKLLLVGLLLTQLIGCSSNDCDEAAVSVYAEPNWDQFKKNHIDFVTNNNDTVVLNVIDRIDSIVSGSVCVSSCDADHGCYLPYYSNNHRARFISKELNLNFFTDIKVNYNYPNITNKLLSFTSISVNGEKFNLYFYPTDKASTRGTENNLDWVYFGSSMVISGKEYKDVMKVVSKLTTMEVYFSGNQVIRINDPKNSTVYSLISR